MFSVRGKRKRRSSKSANVVERSDKCGRRMKRSEELSVSKHIVNAQRQKSQQQAHCTQPPVGISLSHLEHLPNELIQQIFFQCFEINLPRASLHLARALSTESTYNTLILFAYFDDDTVSPTETRLFLPAYYSPLPVEEKVRLQRELLNCRWCTGERISACLPILGRLAMLQAWHRERQSEQAAVCWVENNKQSESAMILPDGILHEIAPLPDSEDVDGMVRHFFAKSEIYNKDGGTVGDGMAITSFKSCLPRIITWGWKRKQYGTESEFNMVKATDDKYGILGARVLPNWLVRGSPWTQGKLELLQLLRQGSRFISRETVLEISAASVFEGMASAIKERHLDALLTLLELHDDVFKSIPPHDETPLVPHPHRLPAHLFHLATKAGEVSSRIMWLLVRSGAESIPKDDNKLTAWALHHPKEGNEIALWLLRHMSETNYNDGSAVDRFIHGRLCWRASTSTFPETMNSFSEDLNYLSGSPSQYWTKLNGDLCD